MTDREVRIPDIGDAKDVEVIELCAKEGDEVAQDDALIVIESDKASMEVPAPVAGTLAVLHVKIGDLVNTDDLIAALIVTGAEGSDESPVSPTKTEQETEAKVGRRSNQPVAWDESAIPESDVPPIEVLVPDIGEAEHVVVVEVLVEAGTVVEQGDPLILIESDKASMEVPCPRSGVIEKLFVKTDDEVEDGTLIATLVVAISDTAEVKTTTESQPSTSEKTPPATLVDSTKDNDGKDSSKVYAGPAVRRMSRELGVNLADVAGSGAKGRILKDDVKAHVKALLVKPDRGPTTGIPSVAYPDFAQYGDVTEQVLTRIQTRGAQNLTRSWLNVVHVTQHDEVDITDLEQFRSALNKNTQDQVRITTLAFIVRCCVSTLKEFPQFNSSIAPELNSLMLKRYYNIGMAVDTEDGLVVPVIRDANTKEVRELAAEIEQLSALARSRRLSPEQISGASFTISNLGLLGGTGFTPIVNAPEVAILGVAKMSVKPWWDGEAFQPRKILPLSLSYDHRAINGAEAGRFMRGLIDRLNDLRRLAL